MLIALGNGSLEMRFWPALFTWLIFWLLVSLGVRLLRRLLRGLRGGGLCTQRCGRVTPARGFIAFLVGRSVQRQFARPQTQT